MANLYDEDDFDYQQYLVESEDIEEIEEQEEDDIKLISKESLKQDLEIKIENDRTLYYFKYKDIDYSGRVLKNISGSKYIFNIETPNKGLKIIDIKLIRQ